MSEKPTYYSAVRAMFDYLGISKAEFCRETGIDAATLTKLDKQGAKPSRLIHYTITNFIREQIK